MHLPGGGLVIDTPGIRSFGLAHVDVTRVIRAFPDLAALTDDCPRACSHDEPDCALTSTLESSSDAAVRERIASLRRLVRSRVDAPDEVS
jgi:ribosome biogenesis GTPase